MEKVWYSPQEHQSAIVWWNYIPCRDICSTTPVSYTHLGELIDVGRYLSKRELEGIPDYERRVLAGEIYHFYYNRPENVMRPYPTGTDYYEAVKLLLPQLAEPERCV